MSENQDYNDRFDPSGQQHAGSPPPGYGGDAPPPPGPPPRQAVGYTPPPQGKKSQGLAGVLSGLIPGLGNIYVGFYTRGFVQAMIFILCIVALSSRPGRGAEPLFGIFLGFWWFFCIIDAVRRAGAYNQFLMGAASMPEMPQDLEIPSQGSKGWGLFLIVVGGIFFLNTKFDFDLEWLEEWWPMILVGFGVWLYYKAKQSEKEKASRED